MADVVYIEQTRLLANALDRASTSCLTVGVFAPILGAFLKVTGTNSPEVSDFVICVVAYFTVAFILHKLALRVLRGLEE
jgi:hypothetical protein